MISHYQVEGGEMKEVLQKPSLGFIQDLAEATLAVSMHSVVGSLAFAMATRAAQHPKTFVVRSFLLGRPFLVDRSKIFLGVQQNVLHVPLNGLNVQRLLKLHFLSGLTFIKVRKSTNILEPIILNKCTNSISQVF